MIYVYKDLFKKVIPLCDLPWQNSALYPQYNNRYRGIERQ